MEDTARKEENAMPPLKPSAAQPANSNLLASFTVKLALFSFVLFGGYYIFFLAPKLALPGAYLQAQKIVTEHKTNLAQNRVAFSEFARLDPLSAGFYQKQSDLRKTLEQTNKDGLEALQTTDALPHVTGVSNEFAAFLNNDMQNALPQLLQKSEAIFQEQQAILQRLRDADIIVRDILRYDAQQDLGSIDPVSREGELIRRATAAASGIGAVIQRTESNAAYDALRDILRQAQNTLYDLIASANAERSYTLRNDAIARLNDAKHAAFAIEKDIVRSPESIALLTRQTNVVLEYDFWLKKISARQARLIQ